VSTSLALLLLNCPPAHLLHERNWTRRYGTVNDRDTRTITGNSTPSNWRAAGAAPRVTCGRALRGGPRGDSSGHSEDEDELEGEHDLSSRGFSR